MQFFFSSGQSIDDLRLLPSSLPNRRRSVSTSKEEKVKETGLDDIEESPTPTHSEETPTPSTKDMPINHPSDEPLFVKSSRTVGASTKQKGYKLF